MKFEFTKSECDYIISEGMLEDNEFELDKLLIYKNKGYTRVKIANLLNVSTDCVDKRTKKLIKVIKKVLK